MKASSRSGHIRPRRALSSALICASCLDFFITFLSSDQVCGEEQRRFAHVSAMSDQRVQRPLHPRVVRKLQQQQRREAEGRKAQLHQCGEQV